MMAVSPLSLQASSPAANMPLLVRHHLPEIAKHDVMHVDFLTEDTQMLTSTSQL